MNNRRYLILPFLFLFGIAEANAQSHISWQRPFGGSGNEQIGDYYSFNDAPDHCTIRTLDGGYILVGGTESSDGDVTGGSTSSRDVWVVKFSNTGVLQWQQTYGGSGIMEEGTSIVQTPDHGYAIAGLREDSILAANDYLLLKIDSVGNFEWQRTYGGSDEDRAYSISLAPDGGYVLAGVTSSYDMDVTAFHGLYDFWIVRTDSSGNLLWQKTLGGTGYDWANCIRLTPEGNYLVAGWSTSNDIDVTNNHGLQDYWLVCMDDSANVLWQRTYGGSQGDWGTRVITTRDGGYALVGYSASTDGDVTGVHGGWDYWMVKTDSAGNLVWQKAYGGTQPDEAYDVIETRDSGYAIIGATSSSNGDVTNQHGYWDSWFVKTDSSGNLEWQTSMGGSIGEWAVSLIQNPDRSFLVTGSASSANGDVVGNHGGWEIWVVNLAPEINVISGTVYVDNNSNAQQDSGEAGVANAWITETVTGRQALTDENGKYLLSVVDTGSYQVSYAAVLPYYVAVPSSHTAHFSTMNETDSLHDFALAPIPGINDLRIVVTASAFRPGFAGTYWIQCKNVGTTSLSATVTLSFDSLLSYQGASLMPALVTPDTLVWQNVLLAPGDQTLISVQMLVPATTTIGTQIHAEGFMEPILNDTTLDDNADLVSTVVTGSFDPNDKWVSDALILTTSLNDPKFMDYIVRFQNTGNDTAFSVFILDTISPLLDIQSFEFVGSSHPVLLEFLNEDRTVGFRFNNILLPDSGTNQAFSNGFARYRIKPLSSVVAGNVVSNTADIFFDFNAPVRTNTTNTLVALPTGLPGTGKKEEVRVYPNPSRDAFTLLFENSRALFSLTVRDISGRTVDFVPTVVSGEQFGKSLRTGMYSVELRNEFEVRVFRIMKIQ